MPRQDSILFNWPRRKDSFRSGSLALCQAAISEKNTCLSHRRMRLSVENDQSISLSLLHHHALFLPPCCSATSRLRVSHYRFHFRPPTENSWGSSSSKSAL